MLLLNILRAFKTAWRWPEVVHESRGMILISRALLIILPVLSVVSTLATGYSDSMLAAVLFSIAIVLSFVLAILLLFQGSYYRVAAYESIEKRAKSAFNEFPEYSDCPIRQYGHSWIGYGHIKSHTFAECVCSIVTGISGNRVNVEDYIKDEDQIHHLYARFISYDEHDDRFEYCEKERTDSFPVTVLDI